MTDFHPRRLIPLCSILAILFSILTSVDKSETRIYLPASARAISSFHNRMVGSVDLVSEPKLVAQAYLVRIVGSQKPLLRLREWKSLAPASLTKLFTAALALDFVPEDIFIEISEDAKKIKETGEKQSNTAPGENFLRDDLIRLSLISSANDAAVALAEAIGRWRGGHFFEDSMIKFGEVQNQMVLNLELKNTVLKNPSGLDEDGHFSSAEDLAKLVEYIWKEKRRLWEISRIIETDIFSKERNSYHISNTNILLKSFPKILGGKTGFTDKARGSLILIYPVEDVMVVIIILRSEDRFSDGRKVIEWLEDTF